jgi:uncharacterized iron-regulated membrane protein
MIKKSSTFPLLAAESTVLLGLGVIAFVAGQVAGIWLWRQRYPNTLVDSKARKLR